MEKMICRDLYLNRLRSWIGAPVVKVITGMRRVGKSTLLRQLADYIKDEEADSSDRLLLIECDSLEYADLSHWEQLKDLLSTLSEENSMKYLLIDEIQNIEGWERVVTALQKENDWDLYISGSNSSLLSGELATRLSGRFVQIEILPFSYREHLQILGRSEHSTEDLNTYLTYGGLPVLYHLEDDGELKNQTLEAIYSTIILHDVVERYNIRNIALLEKIVLFFLDNIGNLSNAKRIADYCKSQKISVGVETVQNYMSYLSSCFFLRRLKRHDLKGRRILEVNEKLYSNDMGLRNAVLRRNQGDIGALLENAVYLELIRRGYSVTVGCYGNYEIDFVAKKSERLEYYQVSYLLASEETVEREFRSLEALKDNYPKFVLSMDDFDFSRNGIFHCNFAKWLIRD